MASGDLDDVSNAVISFVQDVWKVVSELKALRHASPWLTEHQWKQFKQDCIQTIDRIERERLHIGVVAPVHSGKSTLVNALLGIALLPTHLQSSPKRPIEVHYTPRRKGSKLKMLEANGKISTGLEGVRQRLHELLEAPLNSEWHMESPLELNAAFCKALGNEADTVKLDLVEMPSISAVQLNVPLKDKIKNRMDSLDGAIYLIDGTKLRTEREAEILAELKEAFPPYSPQLGNRLHFCVTKTDPPIEIEELDVSETQTHVAALLKEAGFYCQPSQVSVISPLYALLSRLVIADKNDAEIHTQFKQLVWGAEADLVTDKAVWKSKAAKMLDLSGIPKFEERVLGFYHKNCGSLKLMAILDALIRTIECALEVAHAFKTTMTRSLNEMRQSNDRLRVQLDNGCVQMESVKSELFQIEKDITIKVREVVLKLKNTLLNHIGNALSVDEHLAIELPTVWSTIRRDFLALIHHMEPDIKHAEELLKELHEEVLGQIRSEMETVWTVIEDLTRDRHFERVLRTNQDLDHLSKLLEPILMKDLNIQIEPCPFKLKPIQSIGEQKPFAELLETTLQEHKVERSFPFRLVYGAEYSVQLFNGGSIREFFENIVRDTVEASLEQVQSSVHHHLSSQVASAEENIRTLGEVFLQNIESGIESKNLQIEASASSMAKVVEDMDILKRLKTQAVNLRRKIEGMLIAGTTSDVQTELPVNVRIREEPETPGSSRYVPPRSRAFSYEASTPRLNQTDRTESFPFSELSETAVESPKSVVVGRTNGDHWRPSRTGSGNWGAWAPSPRARGRAIPPPVPQRESSSQMPPPGDSFSPRSNFFKGFQQTPRASRGRGYESPHRSGSWTG